MLKRDILIKNIIKFVSKRSFFDLKQHFWGQKKNDYFCKNIFAKFEYFWPTKIAVKIKFTEIIVS